jgi:protein-S-isoprenylcysteine O-methyltransferase Ste14
LSLFACLIAIPFAHGVIPWALSGVGVRHGWIDGSPGWWNLLGLVPLTVAAGLLLWIMVVVLAEMPERVEVAATPHHLLMRGPYGLTRNPIYVAEIGFWVGWAMFYGSLAVSAGLVAFCAVVNFIVLPFEERGLRRRFGDVYTAYASHTPRWFI